ncbi:MAG: carbohydrate ABC transporter permease [Chloroflexota bacterium]|nr:carbohydrate ABC transporter permease [Chloroflexota bacterium]
MTAVPLVETKPRSKRRPQKIALETVLFVVAIVLAIIWLIPFLFMIFTALKSNAELFSGKAYAPPIVYVWENFTRAWEIGKFQIYGVNSLLIAFVKVPLGIFLASMTAFAFSRLRFPYQRVLLLLVVMGTMIPVQVALGPVFHIILDLGLLNTYGGLLLVYIAFGFPYQVYLMYGFFRAIPFELDEAAMIDGCSRFGLYWRIILPLSLPILATLFILDFVGTWNEFSIALVILQDSRMWTIPLGLMGFSGYYSMDYPGLNAGIIITILPVVVVYIIFQRYFIAGLTAGAVKG